MVTIFKNFNEVVEHKSIPVILDEIRTECNCELLVKAAALTSDRIPDYTSEVASRLKLTEEAVNKAREDIRSAMQLAAEPTPTPATK